MAAAFIHGMILAFGLILPLGVQNVFIFNQGAAHKRYVQALPAIITASVCDTLLILLAVLGVSLVLLGAYWVKTVFLCAGIAFLLYMGWSTWKSASSSGGSGSGAGQAFSPRKQMAFAASVSLLNPHAILDTVGVIGTSSLSYSGADKAAFALAAILVSWIWFTGLATAGRILGKLDSNGRFLAGLNKASAWVMWAAAVYMGLSLFR